MSEGGFSTGTFSLISNPEWMTIARDIENTASNWSSGVIGTGHIPRGHTDNSPAAALSVTNTLDPYDQTGNNSAELPGSGWEQKRTHTLSNGSEVWDLSGNVWEWADWDSSIAGLNKSDSKGMTGEDWKLNTHTCKGCDPGESGCEMSAKVHPAHILELGNGLWEIAPGKDRPEITVILGCTSCVLIECLLNSFTELEARICTEKASENPKTIMMNVPVSSTAKEQESKNSRE